MSPRTRSRPFDVVLLGATGLARVAESARVVITTVGPYLEYGEPLVAACAAAGTDYVDLTGEPEFVDRMYVEHHATAERTGARIVHACGFDSIPHDLGALFTVQQLPPGVPVTLRGLVRTNATISGGRLHSGLGQLSRPRAMLHAAAGRRRLEPRPRGRQVRTRIGRPRRARTLGTWLIPLPTIDPDVVRRSALARPDYGPTSPTRGACAVTRAASAPPRSQPRRTARIRTRGHPYAVDQPITTPALVISLGDDALSPVGAVDDLAHRLFPSTSVTRCHHTGDQVPPGSTNDHIGRVRTPATVVDRIATWWCDAARS